LLASPREGGPVTPPAVGCVAQCHPRRIVVMIRAPSGTDTEVERVRARRCSGSSSRPGYKARIRHRTVQPASLGGTCPVQRRSRGGLAGRSGVRAFPGATVDEMYRGCASGDLEALAREGLR
jgi:hypothetical protein